MQPAESLCLDLLGVAVPQRVGERPRQRVAVAVGVPYQPVEGALEVRHRVCAGVEVGRRELDGLGEHLGRGVEPPRGRHGREGVLRGGPDHAATLEEPTDTG